MITHYFSSFFKFHLHASQKFSISSASNEKLFYFPKLILRNAGQDLTVTVPVTEWSQHTHELIKIIVWECVCCRDFLRRRFEPTSVGECTISEAAVCREESAEMRETSTVEGSISLYSERLGVLCSRIEMRQWPRGDFSIYLQILFIFMKWQHNRPLNCCGEGFWKVRICSVLRASKSGIRFGDLNGKQNTLKLLLFNKSLFQIWQNVVKIFQTQNTHAEILRYFILVLKCTVIFPVHRFKCFWYYT